MSKRETQAERWGAAVALSEEERATAQANLDTIAARARQWMVDHGGEAPAARDRIRFCLAAFEDDVWVRGKSAPVVAAIWGYHPNTVERSASEAALFMSDPANVERAREAVTTRALQRSDELYDRARGAADRDAAALAAASNGALETFGKVTGAIASGPAVQVAIDARTGTLRPEVAREVTVHVERVRAVYREAVASLGWDVALLEDRYDEIALRGAPSLGEGSE